MAENDETRNDAPAAEVAPQKRSRKVHDSGAVSEDAPAEVVTEDHDRADVETDQERKERQRLRNEVKPQAFEGDLEELKASGVPAQLVDGRDPDAELIR